MDPFGLFGPSSSPRAHLFGFAGASSGPTAAHLFWARRCLFGVINTKHIFGFVGVSSDSTEHLFSFKGAIGALLVSNQHVRRRRCFGFEGSSLRAIRQHLYSSDGASIRVWWHFPWAWRRISLGRSMARLFVIDGTSSIRLRVLQRIFSCSMAHLF